ncbi:MAG: c-type cytochrome domain-containing protein, partial [Bryobacteraceae bacterium]
MVRNPILMAALVASSAAAQTTAKLPPPADIKIDFNKHVRPVLAEKCFGCHGATQQQSGLRLDARQAALRGGDYGPVIVQGKSAESTLILRLVGATTGLQMPPTGPLSPEEIGILRAWIDQGGDYPDVIVSEGAAGRRKPVDPKVAALLVEIRKGNLAAVRKMAGNASLLKGRDDNDATPLMHASLWGTDEMLRLLLDRGAEVNASSRRKATALH